MREDFDICDILISHYVIFITASLSLILPLPRSSCRNQRCRQLKRSREAEQTNEFMELQEQESADCNLSRSRLIPGQVSCRLWLPVPPLTAWPSPLPPNRLNSFTQEEEMQVSRSNSTHWVPEAVGPGRVATWRNDLQIKLFPSLETRRHLRSCTNTQFNKRC